MKKIISILVVAMLLATCVFAAVPASAANELKIDWTKLDYTVYNEYGVELDELTLFENFDVTKTADSLGVSRKASGLQANSYISKSQFAITATTKYTYEVMAKNNYTAKYSGVPFAIDTEGNVYFIYGSFDNNNDSDTTSQKGKSYVITAKADFDNKFPNSTGNEIDAMYFEKLQQTDGFASFKFEYDGLNVTVYAKAASGGNYVQMGEVVSLPEGSKIAIGVYSRDDNENGNRTTTVKSAKITANNTEAANNLVLGDSNGASELKAEIAKAKTDYNESDYTAESYKALKDAIGDAESIANNAASSASDVATVLAALKTAIEGLELKEVDTSALEAAIAEAEALKEIEWTSISYGMVKKALDAAKQLLEDENATQSAIDAATEAITGRMAELVASGVTAPDDEETEAPATQAPIAQAPITQTPPAAKKGCGSAVATTAVVIGLVATLGTALVVKKKD